MYCAAFVSPQSVGVALNHADAVYNNIITHTIGYGERLVLETVKQ